MMIPGLAVIESICIKVHCCIDGKMEAFGSWYRLPEMRMEHQAPCGLRCQGRSHALLLTPGNFHDMRVAKTCIAALPPSAELVADKGYDSDELRSWLATRGTVAVIPPKRHRKIRLAFDAAAYRQRNRIERMFCCFKDWRRVAMRFDRNIKTFMATVAIAATVIWWL